jgi:hypothetical protein
MPKGGAGGGFPGAGLGFPKAGGAGGLPDLSGLKGAGGLGTPDFAAIMNGTHY